MPAPAPTPAKPPAPGKTPDETIIIVDTARGGVGDLVGDDPAARDRRRGLADSAFVTVVHVDALAGETRGVAEVVGDAAGVEARSLGGLGTFSSIAVRGASPGETQVSIDGVPLSRLGSVTADLSRFDLDGTSELELYRGSVPVALGGAGVGGALNLVTRIGRAPTGERWRLTLGGGSFGARSARVRYGDGDPGGRLGVTASVGYAGADGDFHFFDDGGTNLVTADDRTSTRINNGFDLVDGVVRAGGRRGDVGWQAGVRALGKRQGVPGAGWDQAAHTRLDTAGAVVDGALVVDEPGGIDGLSTRLAADGLVEAQAFHDPDDELGVSPQDRRYLTLGLGGDSAWTLARGRHRLTGAVELRADRYADREVGDAMPLATEGSRVGGALAASDDVGFWQGRLAVEPAVRVDLERTAPLLDATSGDPASTAQPTRGEALVSPRVGVRALVDDGVAIKGGAGRYARLPTALELFGDRGFIVGRPGLRTERGWAADLGVVVAPAAARGPLDRLYLEAAGFWSRPTDVIALVTTGGLVTRPVNLPGADLHGVELVASARLARTLTASANYTWLDARQRSADDSLDGKRLPARPAHAAYLRLDAAHRVRGRLAAAFADASYEAGSFLDEANLSMVPARWLVGAGVKLELGRGVTVAVEGKNLADDRVEDVPLDPPPRPDLAHVPRAVADVAGYPLPGRALYARLDWTF
ncbi:MAG TPA: TonB-dependent receptor [Kofleriaceae bacterium]|nr:TonB-dependent receptor [Kofleriaceae bacterium]